MRASSDLHLDEWTALGHNPLNAITEHLKDLDALIIAGDLADDPLRTWPACLAWIGRQIDPAKVYVFPGNHDYYDHHLDGDDALRATIKAAGMQFAQKRAIMIGNIRFLCCTLWTDFCLFGQQEEAILNARWMADYERIRRDAGGGNINPADTVTAHADHLAWLTSAITEPPAGKTIIIK